MGGGKKKGKKKEKRKRKEVVRRWWGTKEKKKKKEVGDIQRNRARWKRKMRNKSILGVEEIIKNK